MTNDESFRKIKQKHGLVETENDRDMENLIRRAVTGGHGGANTGEDEKEGGDELDEEGLNAVGLGCLSGVSESNFGHSLFDFPQTCEFYRKTYQHRQYL